MDLNWILDGALPRQPLEEVLEPEMARQYRLTRGEQCKFVPVIMGSRWLCSCGEENALGEVCACGLKAETLSREVLEDLRQAAAPRLAQEAEAQAREEAERIQKEKQERLQKRRRRVRRIAIAAGSLLTAAALASHLFFLAFYKWIPAGHYEDGLAALKKGDYQEAHRAFTQAGDYRDASVYLEKFYVPTLRQQTTTGYRRDVLTYTYDEEGYLLSTLEENYEDDVLVFHGQLYNTYSPEKWLLTREDFTGNSVLTYNDRGDPLTVEGVMAGGQESSVAYSYRYDDQGRILERMAICTNHVSLTYSYDMTEVYTYDDRGNVQTCSIEMAFPASQENNYSSLVQYHYADDLLVHRVEEVTTPNDPTGGYHYEVAYAYDDQGRLVQRTEEKNYPKDILRSSVLTQSISYDSQGRLLEDRIITTFPGDSQRDSKSMERYVYDEEGRKLRYEKSISYGDERWQGLAGYEIETSWEYDLLGRVSQAETRELRAEGETGLREIYQYDGGRVPVSKREVNRDEKGKTQEILYTYNENGLVEKMVAESYAGEDTVTQYTYAWFYDPEGMHAS